MSQGDLWKHAKRGNLTLVSTGCTLATIMSRVRPVGQLDWHNLRVSLAQVPIGAHEADLEKLSSDFALKLHTQPRDCRSAMCSSG